MGKFKMRKPNPKGEKSPLPQDITDVVIDKTGTASKIAKAVKYGAQGSTIASNPIIKNLASKSLGVASLMFDPVEMGTNDVRDKYGNWPGSKEDIARQKKSKEIAKNFNPNINPTPKRTIEEMEKSGNYSFY
tara:strand:+ start:359 stop:754 length:396 start_codon:yes stop_codon:yes gene_type:complete